MAERRENLQHVKKGQAEQRASARENMSPEQRRSMDRFEMRQRFDKVTLSGEHSCGPTAPRIGRALARNAINAFNPMQAFGMASRGASNFAKNMGASPRAVKALDSAARHQEAFNSGINRTLDGVF